MTDSDPPSLYLPPAAGEILQGDIFDLMPSLYLDSRPLRVARHFKTKGDHDMWAVHREDGVAPRDGFQWQIDQGGETVLANANLGLAVVLSHDCEIENSNARTLAMIRPLSHLEQGAEEALFSGHQVRYSIFPLERQTTEPTMERAFVDFRRLTSVRPAVLAASVRVASVSDELRAAIAEAFYQYLFRRLETPGRGV